MAQRVARHLFLALDESALMSSQSTPVCTGIVHFTALSLSVAVCAGEISLGMQESHLLVPAIHSSSVEVTFMKSQVETRRALFEQLCKSAAKSAKMMITNELLIVTFLKSPTSKAYAIEPSSQTTTVLHPTCLMLS